jgi:hypothetical protein
VNHTALSKVFDAFPEHAVFGPRPERRKTTEKVANAMPALKKKKRRRREGKKRRFPRKNARRATARKKKGVAKMHKLMIIVLNSCLSIFNLIISF